MLEINESQIINSQFYNGTNDITLILNKNFDLFQLRYNTLQLEVINPNEKIYDNIKLNNDILTNDKKIRVNDNLFFEFVDNIIPKRYNNIKLIQLKDYFKYEKLEYNNTTFLFDYDLENSAIVKDLYNNIYDLFNSDSNKIIIIRKIIVSIKDSSDDKILLEILLYFIKQMVSNSDTELFEKYIKYFNIIIVSVLDDNIELCYPLLNFYYNLLELSSNIYTKNLVYYTINNLSLILKLGYCRKLVISYYELELTYNCNYIPLKIDFFNGNYIYYYVNNLTTFDNIKESFYNYFKVDKNILQLCGFKLIFLKNSNNINIINIDDSEFVGDILSYCENSIINNPKRYSNFKIFFELRFYSNTINSMAYKLLLYNQYLFNLYFNYFKIDTNNYLNCIKYCIYKDSFNLGLDNHIDNYLKNYENYCKINKEQLLLLSKEFKDIKESNYFINNFIENYESINGGFFKQQSYFNVKYLSCNLNIFSDLLELFILSINDSYVCILDYYTKIELLRFSFPEIQKWDITADSIMLNFNYLNKTLNIEFNTDKVILLI